MRYLLLALLLTGCSSVPTKTYKGNFSWWFGTMHDSVECKRGLPLYEKYDIETDFINGEQCAWFSWQCNGREGDDFFNDPYKIKVYCVSLVSNYEDNNRINRESDVHR